MDFSEALKAVKRGVKIARTGWNGKDMWVAYSPGFELPARMVYSEAVSQDIGAERLGQFRPYLMMKTVDGEYVPWVASQTDILATDWTDVP